MPAGTSATSMERSLSGCRFLVHAGEGAVGAATGVAFGVVGEGTVDEGPMFGTVSVV